MNDLELPFPLPPQESGGDMKPWEQRAGPGMGRGSSSTLGSTDADEQNRDKLARFATELNRDGLASMVEDQTDLVHYADLAAHHGSGGDTTLTADSNEVVWRQFLEERLFDTRRVRLEHFHLFEWFPLAPGRFHTADAAAQRRNAYSQMMKTADGRTYFNPQGKASMIGGGGIGAVRLLPRNLSMGAGGTETYYWMTASASGVCHEGFPVLLPRHLYGPVKARILDEGAVPVTLAGEMRYVPEDAVTFFGNRRDIPRLYLHVDTLDLLPQPRAEVTGYSISIAISFAGTFLGNEGMYASFATFDPARRDALADACAWLENYAVDWHTGTIVTDFDETKQHFPRFPRAIFGLSPLLNGSLNPDDAAAFFGARGMDPDQARSGVTYVNRRVATMQPLVSAASPLPRALYEQLRTLLLDCGPLESDLILHAVFANPRLLPWQPGLPEAGNRLQRAELLIDFLDNRFAGDGEPALNIFLRVLATRVDPGDACHSRLQALLMALEETPDG